MCWNAENENLSSQIAMYEFAVPKNRKPLDICYKFITFHHPKPHDFACFGNTAAFIGSLHVIKFLNGGFFPFFG